MKPSIVVAICLAFMAASPAYAQSTATPPATAPHAAARSATPASSARVDLNRATEKQLIELPGIGPVRAKAIIAARPIGKPIELVTKKVLSQGVFDRIKDRIALVNINESSASELTEVLPGIGDVRAKAIVAGRPYAKPDDLVTKGVLTEAGFAAIKDQISY